MIIIINDKQLRAGATAAAYARAGASRNRPSESARPLTDGTGAPDPNPKH